MSNQTLIIYDELGYILSIRQGEPAPRTPLGVPFLWAEIPQGKQLKITDGIGVDVSATPHQAILEDTPKSETEILGQGLTEATMVIAAQQQQIDMQNAALSELTMLVSMQMTGGNE